MATHRGTALVLILTLASTGAPLAASAATSEASPGAPTGRAGAGVDQDAPGITPETTEVPLEPGSPKSEADGGTGPFSSLDGIGKSPTDGGASARGFTLPDTVLSASGLSSGFATVGVTWDSGSAPDGTDVAVRTRVGNSWAAWEPVEVDDVESEGAEGVALPAEEIPGGPGAHLRDGTEPMLVGDVDEVEVALRGAGTVLPAHARLVIIDPGMSPQDAPGSVALATLPDRVGTATGSTLPEVTSSEAQTLAAAAPAATSSIVAPPTIYSRAQWGADESMMFWTPEVARVNGAVVHHTAGTNDYTAAQVPSIIRGIYAYHTNSRGWGDIGYNFLVDKFGRVWEGRTGGIDRAVVGAHATGVNSQLFGLSVMGNYEEAAVPKVAMDAIARLIAWKLSLHGVRANATVTVSGGTLPRPTVLPTVIGHRDVGQTACPGRNLYPRLAELRSAAAALQAAAGSSRGPARDLNADSFPDLVLRSSSAVSLATARSAGWGAAKVVGTGWLGPATVAPGDWTGDGVPDLMLVNRTDGFLWLYPGTPSGSWGTKIRVGTGWAAMNMIVGGHDWNGDGRPDLLARRAADASLWLYPSNGRGGFGASKRIGAGWGGMTAVAMTGDLGDGKPALVARATNGTLITYRGDGTGGFTGTRMTVGGGWGSMTALVGAGDLNGDGTPDLVARDGTGNLWQYAGDDAGSYTGRSRIGTGWQGFTAVLSAGHDGPGQDFYAISGTGTLSRYPYKGRGGFDRVAATGVASSSATAEAIAPGDWDGNGRPDLMVRRTSGDLYLHPGTAAGTFAATGRKIGTGWGSMAQVIGAGDWLGTGKPGLLALDRGAGRIWLYPGDGAGGFGSRILLATGVGATDRIVDAGRWRGGLAPDLITREAGTGRLMLRAGDGGGLLGSPTQIGTGWAGMSSVVGTGDVNGDGLPDLVATRTDGTFVLYPGNGRGGFIASRTMGKAPTSSAVS